MNRIEFVLAFIENITTLCFVAAVIIACGLFISMAINVADFKDIQWKRFHPWFGALVAFSLIATIPNVNSLWKVRVALIKLQLASPENVAKSAGTIERIGHELECKYLGRKDCAYDSSGESK